MSTQLRKDTFRTRLKSKGPVAIFELMLEVLLVDPGEGLPKDLKCSVDLE